MFWYCVFCGRHHTALVKKYQFPYSQVGIKRTDRKDNICNKGLLFIELLKLSLD